MNDSFPADAAQRFLDLTPAMFAVCDADARFVQVGAHWADVLGYEPSALLGSSFMDLVHPVDLVTRDGSKGLANAQVVQD